MEDNKDFNKNEQEREQNAENRLIRRDLAEERKKNNRGNGKKNKKGGYIAAIVALSAVVIALGTLLGFSLLTPLDEYITSSVTEQQSFYELVGYVDGMDTNLSKLVVSKDDEKRQKLLGEVRVQSSLASDSITRLALRDENKYYTVKFINQVSDYSRYLSEKLIDGETFSSSDIETLKVIKEINSTLKKNLSELAINLNVGYDFKGLLEGDDGDEIISKFKDLELMATEYPHMIYDGAFSDGVDGKTAKFLEDKSEVGKMQAEETFKKYFSSYGVKNVELIGESKGKVIETYNFEAVDGNGVEIYAQISKKGGLLVEFNYFKDCSEDKIDQATARDIAENFLKKVGYDNLKAVWTTGGGNVITINFASLVNGVICYPDLIKVNVCRERGVVSGLEASSYIYNHHPREVETASISLAVAKKKADSEISVETSRLAIIPIGQSAEKLAYEFYGKAEDGYYYIYVCALTGKELDIFKVVETTEGVLLS